MTTVVNIVEGAFMDVMNGTVAGVASALVANMFYDVNMGEWVELVGGVSVPALALVGGAGFVAHAVADIIGQMATGKSATQGALEGDLQANAVYVGASSAVMVGSIMAIGQMDPNNSGMLALASLGAVTGIVTLWGIKILMANKVGDMQQQSTAVGDEDNENVLF